MKISSGKNLAGWKVVVGDAVQHAEPEPPVAISDLITVHKSDHSELRANVKRREIMAHNITYMQDKNDDNLTAIHACRFQFRMPDRPEPNASADWLGETIEGGFFVWDGKNTRLDYGLAFQWVVNPWDKRAGNINSWAHTRWVRQTRLEFDTEWHEVWMVLDIQKQTASMVIDGMPVPTMFSKTPKAAGWEKNTVARLQAEIVSINPGPSHMKTAHRTQFRNWSWIKNTDRA
jgi:hypothetical protein